MHRITHTGIVRSDMNGTKVANSPFVSKLAKRIQEIKNDEARR